MSRNDNGIGRRWILDVVGSSRVVGWGAEGGEKGGAGGCGVDGEVGSAEEGEGEGR